MSDTPRTDLQAFNVQHDGKVHAKCGDGFYTEAEFSRQLERELAVAFESADVLNADANKWMVLYREQSAYAEELQQLLREAYEAANSGFWRLPDSEERIDAALKNLNVTKAGMTTGAGSALSAAATDPAEVAPNAALTGEFQIFDGDDFYADVSGPREQAWGEAMRYASQCEGRPRIEEITRRLAPMGEVPPGYFPQMSAIEVPFGEGYELFTELRHRHPAEAAFRRLLAMQLGISYGDDGELQCNEIDMQRNSVEEIEAAIDARGIAKLVKWIKANPEEAAKHGYAVKPLEICRSPNREVWGRTHCEHWRDGGRCCDCGEDTSK